MLPQQRPYVIQQFFLAGPRRIFVNDLSGFIYQ